MLGELIWVDVTSRIDRAESDPGAIAAIPADQVLNGLGLFRIFFKCPEIEVDSITVIVDGQDLFFQPPFLEVHRTADDCFHGLPGFRRADILLDHLVAPTRIYQVIKTYPVDVFLLNKIEYIIHFSQVVAVDGKTQTNPLIHCHTVFDTLHSRLEGPGPTPEFIVYLPQAIQ